VLAVHQEGGKEGTGREEGGGGEPEATTPKCPYCGSTDIVWDHQRGYVVCAGCGTVIEDVSIDYERSASKWRFFKELERKAPSTREAIIARERGPRFRTWLREAVKRVREYEKALREARVVREREIREARKAYREILALLNKPVMLVRVKGGIIDERVREFIERSEVLRRIVGVLERDPVLGALSYRVKLGLALAIRELIKEGDVDIYSIWRATHLTTKHDMELQFRKLAERWESIEGDLEKVIRELKAGGVIDQPIDLKEIENLGREYEEFKTAVHTASKAKSLEALLGAPGIEDVMRRLGKLEAFHKALKLVEKQEPATVAVTKAYESPYMHPIVDRFLRESKTYKNYGFVVAQFVEWLMHKGIDVCNAKAEHVEEFTRELLHRDLSLETITIYRRVIKKFSTFARDECGKESK
jgi:uncharacterized Zn finger protein (UPF0148 family)